MLATARPDAARSQITFGRLVFIPSATDFGALSNLVVARDDGPQTKILNMPLLAFTILLLLLLFIPPGP